MKDGVSTLTYMQADTNILKIQTTKFWRQVSRWSAN